MGTRQKSDRMCFSYFLYSYYCSFFFAEFLRVLDFFDKRLPIIFKYSARNESIEYRLSAKIVQVCKSFPDVVEVNTNR